MDEVIEICLEEVALEGLDGITLSTLWVRLDDRNPQFPLKLDQYAKNAIWEALVASDDVKFCELPEPRSLLVLPSAARHIEPVTGIIMIDAKVKETFYPPVLMSSEKHVYGSCSTYFTRTDVTDSIRGSDGNPKISIEEVVGRYGDSLVAVASQDLRLKSLFGLEPVCLKDLSDPMYAVLEWIGRSRHHGVFQADCIHFLKIDQKLMFYYRKNLEQWGLVDSQTVLRQEGTKAFNRVNLLTLKQKTIVQPYSRYDIMSEDVSKYLEATPHRMAPRADVMKHVTGLHKLVDPTMFRRDTGMMKSMGYLDSVQLPHTTVTGYSRRKIGSQHEDMKVGVLHLLKPFRIKSEEEAEPEGLAADPRDCVLYMGRPVLDQVYDVIAGVYATTGKASTMQDVEDTLKLTFYHTRMLVRKLQMMKIISGELMNFGRQKMLGFIPTRPTHQSLIKEATDSLADLAAVEAQLEGTSQGMDVAGDILATPCAKGIPLKSDTPSSTPKGRAPSPSLLQDFSAARQQKRGDAIRIFLSKNQVVFGHGEFVKEIRRLELEENKKGKVDKQTIVRILNKMAKNKDINQYHVQLTESEQVTPIFSCPEVDDKHPLFQSLVEQEKFNRLGACLKKETRAQGKVKEAQRKETEKKDIEELEKIVKPQHQDRKSTTKAAMLSDPAVEKNIVEADKDNGQSNNKEADDGKATTENENLDLDILAMRPQSDGGEKGAIAASDGEKVEQGGEKVEPGGEKVQPGKEIAEPDGEKEESVEALATQDPKIDGQGEETAHKQKVSTTKHKRKHAPPEVYRDCNDWRRFVKPMPHHSAAQGWFLLGDIMTRMPLSIFVQTTCTQFLGINLSEYLDDPVMRNYPLSQLPKKVRVGIQRKRKLIAKLDWHISLLCKLGLVWCIKEDESSKVKESRWYYLSQKATLMNTTTSDAAYMHSSEKNYPEVRYKLDTFTGVQKYWTDVKSICLNTPLGVVKDAPRPYLDMRYHQTTKRLLQYCEGPHTRPEGEGTVPGDHRGACGFDSSTFAHLRRNWIWVNFLRKPMKTSLFSRRGKAGKKPAVSIVKDGKIVQVPVKIKRVSIKDHRQSTKGGKGLKRKKPPLFPRKGTGPAAKRARSLHGKSLPWVGHQYIDEIDMQAIKKLKTRRSVWTSKEDNFLLLCSLASAVLDQKLKQKKSFVSWKHIRDIMHSQLEVSKDKASFAVSKRSTYIFNYPQTRNNFSTCLMEIKDDEELMSEFMYRDDEYTDPDVRLEEYKELLGRLTEKYRQQAARDTNWLSDLTIEDIKAKYEMKISSWQQDPRRFRILPKEEVTCEADIKVAVAQSMIMGALHTSSYAGYNPCTTFSVFNSYDEPILLRAFQYLRDVSICTRLKYHKDATVKYNRVMPQVPMTYQLSGVYYKFLFSRVNEAVYSDLAILHGSLKISEDGHMAVHANPQGGCCAGTLEALAMGVAGIDLVLPRNIIMIDADALNDPNFRQRVLKRKRPPPEEVDDDLDGGEETEMDQEEEEEDEEEEADAELIKLLSETQTEIQRYDPPKRAHGLPEAPDGSVTGRGSLGGATGGAHLGKMDASQNQRENPPGGSTKTDRTRKLGEGEAELDLVMTGGSTLPDETEARGNGEGHLYSSVLDGSTSLDKTENQCDKVGKLGASKPDGAMFPEGTEKLRDEGDSLDPLEPSGSMQPDGTKKQGNGRGDMNPFLQEALSGPLADMSTNGDILLLRGLIRSESTLGREHFSLRDEFVINACDLTMVIDQQVLSDYVGRSRQRGSECLLQFSEGATGTFEPFQRMTPIANCCGDLGEQLEAKEIIDGNRTWSQFKMECQLTGEHVGRLDHLEQVYQFIDSWGCMGVTLPEMKKHQKEWREFIEHAAILVKEDMVLEVGMMQLRLVSTRNASSWLIHVPQFLGESLNTGPGDKVNFPLIGEELSIIHRVPAEQTGKGAAPGGRKQGAKKVSVRGSSSSLGDILTPSSGSQKAANTVSSTQIDNSSDQKDRTERRLDVGSSGSKIGGRLPVESGCKENQEEGSLNLKKVDSVSRVDGMVATVDAGGESRDEDSSPVQVPTQEVERGVQSVDIDPISPTPMQGQDVGSGGEPKEGLDGRMPDNRGGVRRTEPKTGKDSVGDQGQMKSTDQSDQSITGGELPRAAAGSVRDVPVTSNVGARMPETLIAEGHKVRDILSHQYHRIEGELNRQHYLLLIRKAFNIVLENPGVKETEVQSSMEPILHPVECLHLLKHLTGFGCITRHRKEYRRLKGPFDVTGELDHFAYYMPTIDCMTKFAVLSGNLLLVVDEGVTDERL